MIQDAVRALVMEDIQRKVRQVIENLGEFISVITEFEKNMKKRGIHWVNFWKI